MTFFYDLNKRLAQLASKQDAKQISEDAKATAPKSKLSESMDVAEAGYSAKAGRAGKDLGKPGKNFSKIAKGAAERYGSKAAGERVAGAVLNKLRHPKEEIENEGNAFTGALAKTPKGGKFKVGNKEFTDTSSLEEGTCPSCNCAPCECVEEGNAFTAALKSTPKGGKFKVGGKEFTDTSDLEEGFADMDAWLASREKEKGTGKFDKRERTLPGGMKATTYTRRHADDAEDDAEVSNEPKRRGRPKGKDKGPERVTAKSYKYKAGRPQKTAEDLDSDGVMMTRPTNCSSESIEPGERAEYNDEAGMTKDSLHTIVRSAKELERALRSNENLPEWVQEKIGQIKGMMSSVTDYMLSTHERDVEQHTGREGVGIMPEGWRGGLSGERDLVKTRKPAPGSNPQEQAYNELGAFLAGAKIRGLIDPHYIDQITKLVKQLNPQAKLKEKAPPGAVPEGWRGGLSGERDLVKTRRDIVGNTPQEQAYNELGTLLAAAKIRNLVDPNIVAQITKLVKQLNPQAKLKEKAPPGAKAERMVKGIKKSLSKDGQLSDKDKAIAYATTWKAKKAGKVEEESTDKEDTKAERAGKKVAKDIEHDEGHKGKDDAKAEKAGKKVTKDIEYDDKKDRKEKEEKVDETTVAGSVATAPAGKKSSGGYDFGGSVYESVNAKLENMITEGMSVNISVDEQGKKSINVSATEEDAEALAQLLKMAGLSGQGPSCGCGQKPCGCEEMVDENSPDWPTNTEKLDAEPNLRTYSGGLNGPKSTGQTTVPVVASQLRRQVSMEENVELERNLFSTWKNYKG